MGGSIQSRFSNARPISDFLDFKRISKPQNFGELQSRVVYNVSYFSANYLIIVLMLSLYALITNPILLFVLVLGIGGAIGISRLDGADLNLRFTTLTTNQLYTGLLIIVIPLGIFASPISTVMWLVGASAVTVLGHASLLDKPIEIAFAEDQV